ncbi:hypothetical protein FRACYDRAFT_267558 [Fragilariopsis cylindrus CCMP1102]|uniref:Uncharacterized protein n=1 Tax=Fragilariopsis cylindrus CCMP1102 TaxID=635003 RepID=A0A1E7FZI1_9STRA|nr:hypothetical protein FRACYDRAFT_267558 [Fragilariopsis cylindrus CCMP1102]|eukprot:OEU23548.1 hypothetical protein FRACYDRAFT_267558 [Fragilariopsis cylindrus CCMP1102]
MIAVHRHRRHIYNQYRLIPDYMSKIGIIFVPMLCVHHVHKVQLLYLGVLYLVFRNIK